MISKRKKDTKDNLRMLNSHKSKSKDAVQLSSSNGIQEEKKKYGTNKLNLLKKLFNSSKNSHIERTGFFNIA